MKIKQFLVAIVLILGGLIVSFLTPRPTVQAEVIPPTGVLLKAQESPTCQNILTSALQTMQNTCMQIGRNTVCYGNNSVKAEPNGDSELKFETPGDIAKLQQVKVITTSPLNIEQGTWGLSLLKIQANLPDTMPGQNVMFLLYGDTTIQNTSGDMRAFYFSTGLGNASCKEAPADGIVVRSPNHTQVSFTANGVKITIASTIILKATPRQALTVQLVEGRANVSTTQGSEDLLPGQIVTVPLGGQNGLDATGAPSEPTQAVSDAATVVMLEAADAVTAPENVVNITVNGCISSINGNIVMINGQQVVVDTTVSWMQNLYVGQCIEVNGTLGTGADGSVIITPVSINPSTTGDSVTTSGGNANPTNNGGTNTNNDNNGNNGGGNGNGNGGSNGNNGGGNGNGNNGNGNGNGGSNGNNGNGNNDGNNGGGNGNGNNGNGNGNNGDNNGGGNGGKK